MSTSRRSSGGLVRDTIEKGPIARSDRFYTEGLVYSVDTVSHTARVAVEANLLDGSDVFLEDVPYLNPQTPPLNNSKVTLAYSNSSQHSVYIAGVRIPGNASNIDLPVIGKVVTSVAISGEAIGQIGDLTVQAGAGININRIGTNFQFINSGVISITPPSLTPLVGAISLAAGVNISITNIGNIITIDAPNVVHGIGVAGQVAYWSATDTISGNNSLFWDASNRRLGINNITPQYDLDVAGILYLSGAMAIGEIPLTSAILSAASTTKGFLPPRMTNTQRGAIVTPVAGLITYDATNNKLSYYNGSAWVDLVGGTVTSVGLSLPADFTVTGSPVTTSGTLTAVRATQTANKILAGPVSGGAAAPTYRLLVPADYPIFIASGGSHAVGAVPDPGASAGTAKFLREDATWAIPPGSGTVTSVALTVPSFLSVSGSPITTSGTLAVTLATESANTALMGPVSGGVAVPAFRTLVAADYPTFIASGASHAKGAVPDTPSTAGTAKYLREDATWVDISTRDILFVIDGGGAVITTGVKGYLAVDFPATILQATLLGDQSGSIVVDIWKCTYAQFDAGATHPVAGDKITASAPPTITTATKSQDSTLTGWTTAISAGDILAFNVNSATTIQRVSVILKVRQ